MEKRKDLRLKNYDYSQNGAYFVTICTQDMKCLLSTIVGAIHESPEESPAANNVGAIHESPEIILTKNGKAVKSIIETLEERFMITVPSYCVMPNHIHILIVIENERAIRESPLHKQSKRTELSKIIGYLKANSSKIMHRNGIDFQVWQRGYYDHIIRNDEDFNLHLQYIDENPKKWLIGKDKYYV